MRGFFKRLFRAETTERDPGDDFWYGPAPAHSASGIAVTPELSLQIAVVYDCLQVLSQPLASLPLKVFRRLLDGGKEPVENHPIGRLLRKSPNSFQTAYEFRGQMQWNLALYNNAYAEIRPGDFSPIGALIPLHPTLVQPALGEDGRVWYEVRDPRSGRKRTLRDDEIWHLRGLPLSADGLNGLAPWQVSPSAIAASIAAQDYAARFFTNNGMSGGVLEHPGYFKTGEQRDQFLRAWRVARTGGNAHRDAVLEYGIKYTVGQQLNNEQAQFVETRKELALDIARLWRIPPHKVGILDKATFSNIEHQALEFVTDTLLPWLVLWEQAISRDLILADETYFAEFNVAGLLRGDLQTRYNAYSLARQGGWMSVNDIRRLENQNPIEGGDIYLQPLNMEPAERARQESTREKKLVIP